MNLSFTKSIVTNFQENYEQVKLKVKLVYF